MKKPEIKCSHTVKCRWRGNWDELVPVLSEDRPGFKVHDNTCPKCGGKEFWEIKREPSHD